MHPALQPSQLSHGQPPLPTTAQAMPKGSFENTQSSGADVRQLLPNAQDDLTPLRVRALFRAIPEADYALIDMSACFGKPETLLIQKLLVPPIPIRPSVDAGAAGSNEDDLTVKLADIVKVAPPPRSRTAGHARRLRLASCRPAAAPARACPAPAQPCCRQRAYGSPLPRGQVNNIIRCAMAGGKAMVKDVMEDWEYLQLQCALYLQGPNVPGIRPEWQSDKKSLRSFAQRLKGKQGRFRGNLSGKRVDFSGRTVISPDPNLLIDEVCVPIHMAKVLTYPERVFAHNLSKLRQLVIRGPDQWPGANYVEVATVGNVEPVKRSLRYGDRRRTANELKVGDMVERHLSDGDVVLFNRQPSLHKLSIMAHRARVMEGRTLRFNECVCAPYNADFDGDEMNMHLPQTEEARTEALLLMGVLSNLITPRNGEIVVSATQDFLTGAYKLSIQSAFFTRDQFCRLACYMSDASERVDIPPPAILKPIELWTGKQLFSVLLCPSQSSPLRINLEVKNKKYNTRREKPEPLHMCPDDGWVCFRNGELMSGVIDKSIIGGGAKESLFAVLLRDYSAEASALCMSRLAKLTARFLADHGFSIGIADVQPTDRLTSDKAALLEKGYEDCMEKIRQFEAGTLQQAPGCTPEQTLESEMNGRLSKIRDDAGEICKKELHYLNAPLTMATCGSKGSFINISQMVACVGQQSVNGKRMPNGFVQRSLPHFPRNSREPAAKGFVANSFYTGLHPTEFFFHTMGGREGLVDTAVKTAETGYMARRLMKALEDLTVEYDGSVRNSEGNLIQFRYGDDGLDPAYMEAKDGGALNFERVCLNEMNRPVGASSGPHVPLTGDELMALAREHVASAAFQGVVTRNLGNEPSKYERSLLAFFSKLAAQHDGLLGVSAVERERAKEEEEQPRILPRAPPRADGAKPAARPKRNRRVVLDDGESDEEAVEIVSASAAVKVEVDAEAAMLDVVKQEVQDLTGAAGAAGAAGVGLPSQSAAEQASARQRLSREQVLRVLDRCLRKYSGTRVEAGSAVGAIGAQSIGEPGTQMTLKTFHFAGVASMNITQGVPRIKEIINAAKTVATPIITASLDDPYDMGTARVVKGRIERTELGQVCRHVARVITQSEIYILFELDLPRIAELKLELTAHSVMRSILAAPKLKVRETEIEASSKSAVRVYPARCEREDNTLYELAKLAEQLKKVRVCGLDNVARAIIVLKDDAQKTDEERASGRPCHHLLIEGTALQAVMGVKGLRGAHSKSTHIMEVEKCLGIEAARNTIVHEIQSVMGSHGMDIDNRHVSLLADVMTFRGEVLGITRFGMPKMRQSVLSLASFEKTTDHLFDAAFHSRVDAICGVSECIIMGIPIQLGTGLFQLLQRVPKFKPPKAEGLLFPRTEKKLRL